MIIDPSLRDMILFIYHHIKNFNSSGGGGSVTTAQLNTALANKVDKVAGKGLSTNDYTDTDKNKISLITNKLDKGGYTGTAQDLKNAIDTVDSKTIHWNDVQNKPELDFIPTSWNKKNGGPIIDTSDPDELKIYGEVFSDQTINIYNSSIKTNNYYEAVDSDDNNKFTRIAPGFILFNRDAVIRKEIGNTIAFDDFNLSNEYVYIRIAGVKIGDNSAGNRLLLDNGGTKPLTDFATVTRLNEVNDKISGLSIGGRNLVLMSRNKRTLVGYTGVYWGLLEPAKVGVEYTFSCYAEIENGMRLTVYFADVPGQPRQYIVMNLVNGYNEAKITPNYEWTQLCAFYEVHGISPVPTAHIEKIKFEKGNIATDWSYAHEDFIPQTVIYVDSSTFYVTADVIDKIVHINRDCVIHYNEMPLLSSITFRKVYDGGQITFHGGGTLKYTGATTFNGNSGSTATLEISADIHRIYIDIKNV